MAGRSLGGNRDPPSETSWHVIAVGKATARIAAAGNDQAVHVARRHNGSVIYEHDWRVGLGGFS